MEIKVRIILVILLFKKHCTSAESKSIILAEKAIDFFMYEVESKLIQQRKQLKACHDDSCHIRLFRGKLKLHCVGHNFNM